VNSEPRSVLEFNALERESAKVLTPDDVEAMSYIELMSQLEETNRPPGGLGSIMAVRSLCNLGPSHAVLDVGCNTGYVAFKLADLTKCSVVGIDLSATMIATAERKRKTRQDHSRLSFHVDDALALSFQDNLFDLTICGGSLPFMEKPSLALDEMTRVVRPGGFVCSIDFYYSANPPVALLDDLEEVLGFRIEPLGSDYWRNTFQRPNLELALSMERRALPTAVERVEPYVTALLEPMRQRFSTAGFAAASRRVRRIFDIFARNNDHLSYVINIACKVEAGAQPTFFT
jgi:SAM-dependent methyltransferase